LLLLRQLFSGFGAFSCLRNNKPASFLLLRQHFSGFGVFSCLRNNKPASFLFLRQFFVLCGNDVTDQVVQVHFKVGISAVWVYGDLGAICGVVLVKAEL